MRSQARRTRWASTSRLTAPEVGVKARIKRLINKWGYELTRCSPDAMGVDPLADMARFLHTDRPTIFDVGAHMGQSIQRFRERFPGATIHSFEPSPTSFAALTHNASAFGDVHLWNCGLGSATGKMTLLENRHSEMSSFLPLGRAGWGRITTETVVEVHTIDRVCCDMNIQQIDILKSDTQGFDLEVFRGAETMMRACKIGLIYFEMIFSEMYENLPSFAEIFKFLASHGFLLVSFYQFRYHEQLAMETDALFVHKSYTAM